ncbi:MAG: ammonium transporter [Flavobacteriaceae bacterium]|nr:ammonium transporter [Flavobacteriaceae bacterium]|tara:strand:+ start:435 stop:1715 length:1281 start_codon:yes stop_codon:yes gene_type:complete
MNYISLLYNNVTNMPEVNDDFTILWILISGILVFFMQAGFTLLESGMTQSKNAVNIAMKNFMDISVATITFWVIGYGLMYGAKTAGFISLGSDVFFNAGAGAHDVFFQLVFAATAATIVSGAIAGRTKYSTYIIFTIFMTAIIYPISGGWQWYGDGAWLADMGFIDFAGSSIVHAVGGVAALVAAIMVGPRIGKFGKDGSVNSIPGSNLLLGTLGVFILWLGWFGFNGGSQLAWGGDDSVYASAVVMATQIAAAAGGLGALITSWLWFGKPSLSQTLNGCIAGLVSITAGCGNMTFGGAFFAGLIGGILVVASIEFVEKQLKIDDAIGAFSAHGTAGIWGTIVIGLWGVADPMDASTGLGIFNGGDGGQLVTQIIGALSYCAWAAIMSALVLGVLKATIGLRVSEAEEAEGLDVTEHGEKVFGIKP